MIEAIWQDLNYAIRSLRRTPVFTAAAILTLGLGIGVNAALFTMTRSVLFRTLPVDQPERLVEVGCINPNNPDDPCRTHYPGFVMYRDSTHDLADVFAFAPTADLAANIDGRGEVVAGLMLSGNAYAVLGMSPHVGRLFIPADDEPGAPLVAVLSYDFWQRRFGGDPGVVGRTLRLSNQVVTVVGVTPPAFRGVTLGVAPDVTVPIGAADLFRQPGSLDARAAWWVYIMGRLRPGVTIEQAHAALEPTFLATLRVTLDALPADAAAGFKEFTDGFGFRLTPAATGGISYLRQTLSQPIRILWGIVFFVLLIMCANLAGLLLARVMDRRREFGVRLTLGAGRVRLAAQVLTESAVLALCGGVVGLAVAGWAAPIGVALAAGETGFRALDLRPDGHIVAFTALVSLLVAVVIGAGTVVRAAGADSTAAWRASAASASRVPLARTLVAGQMALTMMLLVGAVLFARSLANARSVDPGFDSDRLLTVMVAPGMAGYAPEDALEYLKRSVAAVERVPGVRAATYHAMPLATGLISQTGVGVPGFTGPADQMVTGQNRVGPRFAEALGLRLIAGRDLRSGDEVPSAASALVNERFARHFFGTIEVVGRSFVFDRNKEEYSIAGVVSDAHDRSVTQPTENWIYVPFTPDPAPRVRVTVRASNGLPAVMADLERALQAVDPAVPVYGVRTVNSQIEETLRRERLLATLGSAFGGLTLTLVAIGIYATFSGLVLRRRREIGIRMAVGADRLRIARWLARQASVVALFGLGAGTIGAGAAAGVIRSQLFNVEPIDSGSFVIAAAVLLIATVIATWVPARRAMSVDPAETLRAE